MLPAFAITSADGVTWTGPGRVRVRATEYTVAFTRDRCRGPCLTLTPVGGGAPIECVRGRCGCSYAEFTALDPAACDGAWDPHGPCRNAVTVRVEWSCCPIPGWAGDGWYCVRDAGTDGPCVAVDLSGDARCDDSLEICSGPYPSEPTATFFCGGSPVGGASCTGATVVPVGQWVTGEAVPVSTSRYFCVALPAGRYRFRFYGGNAAGVGGPTFFVTSSLAGCGVFPGADNPFYSYPGGTTAPSICQTAAVPCCDTWVLSAPLTYVCVRFSNGSLLHTARFGFAVEEGGPC